VPIVPFFSIAVEYTCFANKLSILTRLPGPVRDLVTHDDLRPDTHPLNAPREIMRLINWLMSGSCGMVCVRMISPENNRDGSLLFL
jgi:hypothetical protein